MRLGSSIKELAKSMWKYYSISRWDAAYRQCMKWAGTVPQHACRCSESEVWPSGLAEVNVPP